MRSWHRPFSVDDHFRREKINLVGNAGHRRPLINPFFEMLDVASEQKARRRRPAAAAARIRAVGCLDAAPRTDADRQRDGQHIRCRWAVRRASEFA